MLALFRVLCFASLIGAAPAACAGEVSVAAFRSLLEGLGHVDVGRLHAPPHP